MMSGAVKKTPVFKAQSSQRPMTTPIKMGATIAMFVAIAYGYHGVQWVPLLVTYLVALKTYWIALAWR